MYLRWILVTNTLNITRISNSSVNLNFTLGILIKSIINYDYFLINKNVVF